MKPVNARANLDALAGTPWFILGSCQQTRETASRVRTVGEEDPREDALLRKLARSKWPARLQRWLAEKDTCWLAATQHDSSDSRFRRPGNG